MKSRKKNVAVFIWVSLVIICIVIAVWWWNSSQMGETVTRMDGPFRNSREELIGDVNSSGWKERVLSDRLYTCSYNSFSLYGQPVYFQILDYEGNLLSEVILQDISPGLRIEKGYYEAWYISKFKVRDDIIDMIVFEQYGDCEEGDHFQVLTANHRYYIYSFDFSGRLV